MCSDASYALKCFSLKQTLTSNRNATLLSSWILIFRLGQSFSDHVVRPYVSDTSPKSIDREGRTGTSQVATYSLSRTPQERLRDEPEESLRKRKTTRTATDLLNRFPRVQIS